MRRGTVAVTGGVIADLLRLPKDYRVVGLRAASLSSTALLFVDVEGPRIPPPIAEHVPALLTPIYRITDAGAFELERIDGLEPEVVT